MKQASVDFRRVEKALNYIDSVFPEQPPLAEIAASAGLSEFHFQRIFQRWVGISPKRFFQYLTRDRSLMLLRQSRSVLDAALDAGLSGPGRLHDLLVECDAMTPGEIRSGGDGLEIRCGKALSPFGPCILAVTERGLWRLEFLTEPGDEERLISEWKNELHEANFVRNDSLAAQFAERIFSAAPPHSPLPVLLKGTNFQIQVWRALLQIPSGSLLSYEDIAEMIGRPDAVRAVAGAVAANRIAFVIPCHRVIRKMGVFHNYRYGPARKKAILGWEAARSERQ